MDMLDYIKWRGDLSFDERPLNEVDSLIFSTLSYETFEGIQLPKTMKEVSNVFFKKYTIEELSKRKSFTYRSFEVLKAASLSNRFEDIIVDHYVNVIDEEKNIQFSAVTFSFKNKWKYIAFRGTDDTIVGWKEDFMLLYKDEIESYQKIKDYLNLVFREHKPFSNTKYYIGGHSKGGHLALYASSLIPEKLHKHIISIYNFDGPGFDQQFYLNGNVKKLLPKMTTYTPAASFFGRLFKHHEKIQLISSEQKGLLQHSMFNWQVNVNRFNYENNYTDGSDKAIQKFNETISKYTIKEREHIVESLFDVYKQLNIFTIEDLLNINPNRVFNSLKQLNELDNDTKKVIFDFLMIMINVAE